MKTRTCKRSECGQEFPVVTRGDNNRQYCSQSCSKTAHRKRIKGWQDMNPDLMRSYTQAWRDKNPDYYRGVNEEKRSRILELLGGKCIVCGVTNGFWLHIDYVPTTRGLPYRHPRHFGYIAEHRDDFRLLCANHHYELTLTGKIEGTDITQ